MLYDILCHVNVTEKSEKKLEKVKKKLKNIVTPAKKKRGFRPFSVLYVWMVVGFRTRTAGFPAFRVWRINQCHQIQDIYDLLQMSIVS